MHTSSSWTHQAINIDAIHMHFTPSPRHLLPLVTPLLPLLHPLGYAPLEHENHRCPPHPYQQHLSAPPPPTIPPRPIRAHPWRPCTRHQTMLEVCHTFAGMHAPTYPSPITPSTPMQLPAPPRHVLRHKHHPPALALPRHPLAP